MSVGQRVEQGRDLGGERKRRAALCRMQPPDLARALRRGQRVRHGHDGRGADAGRHQDDRAVVVDEVEIASRRGGFND